MDYFLTEEQQMIKELAARIADEKIKPVAGELDEKEEFPWDLMRVLGESDLFAVWVPEKYGGLGGGVFEQALVVEELSRACSGVAVSYAASGFSGIHTVRYYHWFFIDLEFPHPTFLDKSQHHYHRHWSSR